MPTTAERLEEANASIRDAVAAEQAEKAFKAAQKACCPVRHQEFGSDGRLVDFVNNPPHYTQGGIECIDAIASALGPDGFSSYLRGAVIKYLWRGPHKGSSLQDYQKAEFYLKRLIEVTEKMQGGT